MSPDNLPKKGILSPKRKRIPTIKIIIPVKINILPKL